jgi:hypothetical protein
MLLVQTLGTGQVQPGAVTGRLLSPKGVPAAGVRIAAVPVAGNDKASSPVLVGISQTDADGGYRLEGIPPGRYYIFAGLIDFPSYYPDATSVERATAVVVEAGSTLSGINFSMARPVAMTVAGRLVIPSTMQVATGWTVSLAPTGRTANAGTGAQQMAVRSDGTFEFLQVVPGEYRVSSNVRGSSAAALSVIDTDHVNVLLPVVDCDSGVKVSGKLTGVSVPTARNIALAPYTAGCTYSATVGADGAFAFNNIPEGVYQYRLTPNPIGWSAASLIVGKSDLTSVEVDLPSALSVNGRAAVEDGGPFPRTSRGEPVEVVAKHTNGQVSALVQDDGSFELRLPRGRYTLSVTAVPSGHYVKAIRSGFMDVTTLNVTDTPPGEVELILGLLKPRQTGVRVSGQLTFAPAGDFPKSEGVLLVPAGRRNDPIYESSLAPDGSFQFSSVPPGTYNLETYPDNPAALYGIVVGRSDVEGIEYLLPVLVNVKGGIEWPNSVKPRDNLSVQFTRKEGDRVMAWGALVQSGAFHFYLPEGDYRFSISNLLPDFDLGAVTSGDVNVLDDGLKVRADGNSPSLRVILRGK